MPDSVTTPAGTMSEVEFLAIVENQLSDAAADMLLMGVPASWLVIGFERAAANLRARIEGKKP